LLLFLVENPGRVLTKEEIMGAVWPDAIVSDNSLARAVAQIRKALDDDSKSPKYVETVPSVGYRFIGDFKEQTHPSAAAFEGDSPAGVTKSERWVKLTVALCACLALATGGLVWVVASRSSSIPYPLHVNRVSMLTGYPGDEREPAISPDGSYVAFSWSGTAGDNYDIYVVHAGGQHPLRLTSDPAPDSYPAWSPDGSQIAFIRRNGSVADIILVPPLGGPERTLHRFSRIGADLDFSQHPVLAWSPDGKWIVFSGQSGAGEKYRLFALSLETGAIRALSSPNADLLGDSSPSVQAGGRKLAFVRYLAPRNGRLLIQPLGPDMITAGELTEVKTSGLALRSPTWLDAEQLLFADATRIFQWEPGKGSVTIYAADGGLGGFSLGAKKADGTWQAVVAREKHGVDLWVIPLNVGGTKSTAPAQILQRSATGDNHPDFSPNGRQIAFVSTRSGMPELWVSDADGGNPRQLTTLGAHVLSYPKWSPDGTRIAFHARVPDVAEVYVVDVNQGVPRQITHENPGLALATWSNDGRFLYASTLVGGTGFTYRIPAGGGPMERLWEGAWVRETADGNYVLYWKSHRPGIFRRSLKGDLSKSPEELLIPDFWPNNQLGGYAPVADGIYYVSGDAEGRPGPFRYFAYASHKSIDVAPAAPGLGRGFTVSPDRRRLVFAASPEAGGDLLSLELR
jgi:Tol biopolymer transport system component